ncbi:hypothetical protein B0T16DRAFT_417822 [Cercophora newfieldiana]|uniref:Uncharacterized protein n=1 Tax=Cercophora newfieldiana TaxID=92897 RepID=A0AA39Y1Y9_9PEZI|nr:hypothetical protein B0T16DRAFT_417822 [Cercophora newfieldiana]
MGYYGGWASWLTMISTVAFWFGLRGFGQGREHELGVLEARRQHTPHQARASKQQAQLPTLMRHNTTQHIRHNDHDGYDLLLLFFFTYFIHPLLLTTLLPSILFNYPPRSSSPYNVLLSTTCSILLASWLASKFCSQSSARSQHFRLACYWLLLLFYYFVLFCFFYSVLVLHLHHSSAYLYF